MNAALSERHTPTFLLRRAERVLSACLGGPVRLREQSTFPSGPAAKSIVLRCDVIEAPAAMPATVIVKKVREDGVGIPYAPESAETPNAAHRFLDDWAALEFLSQLPVDPPLAPRLYGGDRELGLIVLEDLGDGDGLTVHELLHTEDTAAAEEGLLRYITAIGRLHATTIGRSAEHARIRAKLGPRPRSLPLYHDPWPPLRATAPTPDEIDEVHRQYHAAFATLGITAHKGVDGEIAAVTRVVDEKPGPFLAFCQGDQNGVGGLIPCGESLRFFDFDCAGFRHALLEGIPARITWGGMVRVPARVAARMDATYQAELARGCPAAADDAALRRAMVEASAHWNIFHILHRLPDALERDRPRGPSTLRQQCLAWIDAFAEMAEEFGHLPALSRSARDLTVRLRGLWPPETHHLPTYPAFDD